MTLAPVLRAPGASAKEWLHFSIHQGDLWVAANVSNLGGVTRVLVLVRVDGQWHGGIQSLPLDWPCGTVRIRGAGTRVAWERDHWVVRVQAGDVALSVHIDPWMANTLPSSTALGSGQMMHWVTSPRGSVTGLLNVAGRRIELDGAAAYQDHNWGPFQWGRGTCWDWGVMMAGEYTLVLMRSLHRSRNRVLGQGLLVWRHHQNVASFVDEELEVAFEGLLRPRGLFRLPEVGGLLSPGTATGVPEAVRVRADNGFDRLDLELSCLDQAQVVIPDEDDLTTNTCLNEVAIVASIRGSVAGQMVPSLAHGCLEVVVAG